jgi:hypothetical protein
MYKDKNIRPQPELNPLPHRSKRRLSSPILAAILAMGALAAPFRGRAATVWTGTPITFTQTSPYPNPPGDRDQLTPSVSLTRALTSGLFNGVSESSYTHDLSPAGTLWAVGSLADYATLNYASWEATGGGRPVLNLPGQPLVVHLIAEDIYLSLKFTYLGGHGAGGFSYQRSTPAVANPPSVTITNPIDGASFIAPATVTIQAAVSDSGGNVTNVEFFQGTASLGSVTSSPFAVTVNNLGAADYTFSAVATDDGGLSATNAIVVHVVTPVPIVLGALQRTSPTSFQFTYSANVGLRYVVEWSGDLMTFTPITTNTAASNPVTFLDTGAVGFLKFYRVGRLPNP